MSPFSCHVQSLLKSSLVCTPWLCFPHTKHFASACLRHLTFTSALYIVLAASEFRKMKNAPIHSSPIVHAALQGNQANGAASKLYIQETKEMVQLWCALLSNRRDLFRHRPSEAAEKKSNGCTGTNMMDSATLCSSSSSSMEGTKISKR
uniref:Uncharacterized protein n=1 Tax=Eutreptiella gymnastica TaxID=73025 RepID=A0A7S4G7Y3_9EUGL